MNDDSSFYITLPSDSSMETFSKNNAAHWATKLRSPVLLKGKWEVCLSELHYVNTVFNIPDDQFFFIDTMTEGPHATNFDAKKVWVRLKIDVAGYVENPKKLLDLINSQVPFLTVLNAPEKNTTVKGVKFEFVAEDDQRVRIRFATDRIRIIFWKESYDSLRKALGLPDNSLGRYCWDRDYVISTIDQTYPFEITGEKSVNLSLGNQWIYVYCDAADFSCVGDCMAQILRVVPIKDKAGAMVTERYDIGHYVPLLVTSFDSIRIILANDKGADHKFHSGKSLVKLHFRRRT